MPNLQITWSARDIAAFQRAMKLEVDVTGKEAAEAVKHGFILFAKSARAQVKRSVRFRKVVRNPNPRPARPKRPYDAGLTRAIIARRRAAAGRQDDPVGAGLPYLIQYLYQRRPPRFVGTSNRNDKRRILKRRGMSRWAWGRMMHDVFPSQGEQFQPYDVPEQAMKRVDNRADKHSTNPSVYFWDKLVYLLKVHPNVGTEALQRATRGLLHQMDNRLKQEMLRVWHS